MGSEWEKKRLNEIGRIVTGRTPPGTKAEHFGGETPFLTPTDMDGRRFVGKTSRTLSKSGKEVLLRNLISEGVAVSCIGWQMGKSVLIDRPTVTNQQINAIIPNQLIIEKKYLYYALSTRRDEIFQLGAGGSRTPILKKSDFERLEIHIPTVPEQKAIAAVLGSLDDKIELNRQMNATLEGMAQALFKSWFVDFDPVIDNALAAGNPIPQPLAQRAELRQAQLADGTANREIAQQFPDSFQFTDELGWIPAGWEISTIGDEVTAVGGGTPSTKNELFWDGDHLFCTPKDMSRLSSLVLLDTERHLTDLGASKVSSGILPKGTLLMSSRAPIGYLAITEQPVTVNQGIIALLKNDMYQPVFLLSWIRSNMEKIVERANGSTFLEISKKNFKPIPFLKPSERTLSLFNAQAKPIHQKIVTCVKNTTHLAKLRDTLLPKLISGELRIPDAEKLVDTAVKHLG
jgi:type I restriction enzyme S subunit